MRRWVRAGGRGGRGVPRPAAPVGRRPARQARAQKVGGHANLLLLALRRTGPEGLRGPEEARVQRDLDSGVPPESLPGELK